MKSLYMKMIKNLYFICFAKNYVNTEFIFNIIAMIIFIYNINDINIETCSLTLSLLNKKNILSQIIKYPHIIKRFSQGGKKAGQELAKKVKPTTPPPIPPAQNNYKSPQQVAKNNTNNNQDEKKQTTNTPKFPTKENKSLIPPIINTADKKSELEEEWKTFKINEIVEGKNRNEVEELSANFSSEAQNNLEEWRKKVEKEFLTTYLANTGILNSFKQQNNDSEEKNDQKENNSASSTSTQTKITVDSASEDNLTNDESQKLLDNISKIENLKNFLKVIPSNITEIDKELILSLQILKTLLIEPITKNFDNYQQLLIKNDINFFEECKKFYPNEKFEINKGDDPILYYYHKYAQMKWQLQDNKRCLEKIKEALENSNISEKSLLSLANKIALIKYSDVNYIENLKELSLNYKQKEVGEITIKASFLIGKQKKKHLNLEDEIVILKKPPFSQEQILEKLNNGEFFVSSINLTKQKYETMIMPHSVNAHFVINIELEKGKRLILCYLTSTNSKNEKDISLSGSQLKNKEKTQNLMVLSNLCEEKTENMEDYDEYKKFILDENIKAKLIELIEGNFQISLNSEVIEVPIMTVNKFKKYLLKKVDEQLILTNNSIKEYENHINKYKLQNKDKDRLLELFLDIHQRFLNNDAKDIVNWYKGMTEQIKYLEDQKKKADEQIKSPPTKYVKKDAEHEN